MLTPEEDMEITSLKKRGWSISAIARHVGHDRKTVRGYLSGEREPGVRERAEPDLFDAFEPYVRQRLGDDQHVWATTLFDELVALGYPRSYQTFTRQLRRSSGTGSNWTRRRGARRPTCSSARSRIRAVAGRGSPSPMTKPISSSGSTSRHRSLTTWRSSCFRSRCKGRAP